MEIYKSSTISTNINEKSVELGYINANFYSEDENSAAIRMFINWNDKPIDLSKITLRPKLDLFCEDGSIFRDETYEIIDASSGLIQYRISSEVIKHIGKVNAKLFLVNDNESIHAANFTFNVIDSGVESAIQPLVTFNLIDDAMQKIVRQHALELLGDDFKIGVNTEIKDYMKLNADLFRGKTGLQGPIGLTGLQGEQGPQGEQGTQGEKGDTGSEGPIGPQGEKGDTGSAGPKGEPGDTSKLIARNVVSSGETRPLITFVDDDGRTEVITKWEPILQEKGNKLTIPLITQWMDDPDNNTVITWEDVHRLKEQYGVEFVSHTHEHKHAQQLTEEEVENELKLSKEILKREGLTHNIIVQPYGENTDSVRRISRNYYKANIGTKEGINTTPLDTFRMYRITLGESLYTTFEQYKEKLDEAIANNGWIIFKSHSQYPSFNENQQQLIRQIIDYARQNNMIEVSLEEGLDLFGNLVDVGDYTARAQGSDYYILDKKGRIHSNKYGISYRSITNNGSDINTPVENFEYGLIHEQIYGSRAQGFPENKSGTLETYRSTVDYYSFQFYYPVDNNSVYKRFFNRSLNTWGSFEKQNSDYITTSTKNSLNTTPVTEFNSGTTKEIVQTVNATGFPENKAGILETNKLNPASYCYQVYYIYNNNHIYKRFYDSVNNWTAWERIENTKLNLTSKQNVSVEVPANNSVEVTFNIPGITNSDNVIVTPTAGIEQGLMFNGFINAADSVRIRFYNFTSSPIVTNRPYKIDVIKNN